MSDAVYNKEQIMDYPSPRSFSADRRDQRDRAGKESSCN